MSGLIPSPAGGRVGRHPARIYSRWDTGRGIGQGEGGTNKIPASFDRLRMSGNV